VVCECVGESVHEKNEKEEEVDRVVEKTTASLMYNISQTTIDFEKSFFWVL